MGETRGETPARTQVSRTAAPPLPTPTPESGRFCTLPGAVIYTDAGQTIVPGATGQPSFSWLTLPIGFCAHHYATVANARQLRFAPGGELFVSSPSTHTVSGGLFGLGAIAVVPDDNGDGLGDSILTFKANLPSTVGMLFANSAFYHQEGTQIVSQPYTSGQRADNGEDSLVEDITVYKSAVHWPKTLDVSDTGSIFVGNGGDEPETCLQPMPFQGGVLQLDGTDGGRQVAMGMRNPIAVKCHRDGNDLCFAVELGLDESAVGREKLLLIHSGDDWGYPCCASTNLPFSGVTVACPSNPSQQCPPDCSAVVQDTNSFLIGNTPFGFDFVDSQFPAPWSHKVIVSLHGALRDLERRPPGGHRHRSHHRPAPPVLDPGRRRRRRHLGLRHRLGRRHAVARATHRRRDVPRRPALRRQRSERRDLLDRPQRPLRRSLPLSPGRWWN